MTDAMLTAALDLAGNGWPVFPLRGKVPAIAGGRGVLDASTDLERVAGWWEGPYRGANIGARVPSGLVVIDVDPRNGGLESLAALETEYGPLPPTLTVWSGREDSGRHLYWLRPPGELTSAHLPKGIDVKTSAGYCVVPPSVHPTTGKPYRWQRHTIAPCPQWLAARLRPPRPAPVPRRPTADDRSGGLIRAVAEAAEGRRNAVLYWAACRAAAERAAEDVYAALVAAAVTAGLPQTEATRTVQSARRRIGAPA